MILIDNYQEHGDFSSVKTTNDARSCDFPLSQKPATICRAKLRMDNLPITRTTDQIQKFGAIPRASLGVALSCRNVQGETTIQRKRKRDLRYLSNAPMFIRNKLRHKMICRFVRKLLNQDRNTTLKTTNQSTRGKKKIKKKTIYLLI